MAMQSGMFLQPMSVYRPIPQSQDAIKLCELNVFLDRQEHELTLRVQTCQTLSCPNGETSSSFAFMRRDLTLQMPSFASIQPMHLNAQKFNLRMSHLFYACHIEISSTNIHSPLRPFQMLLGDCSELRKLRTASRNDPKGLHSHTTTPSEPPRLNIIKCQGFW